MRLTVWGHACVTLDHDGGRVVLDPGAFSQIDAALDGASAVLVTHEHADHVVPDRLAAELAARPGLAVHAPGSVIDLVRGHGAPAEQLHRVAPGDALVVAGFEVRVGGGTHAEVHRDIPRPANVGYLVGPVWHPGDSLDLPPGGAAEVLLVPAGGPWLRLAEAIDLVRAMAPRLAVPIHDAVCSEAGAAIADRLLSGLGGAGEYRRLSPGETMEL